MFIENYFVIQLNVLNRKIDPFIIDGLFFTATFTCA